MREVRADEFVEWRERNLAVPSGVVGRARKYFGPAGVVLAYINYESFEPRFYIALGAP